MTSDVGVWAVVRLWTDYRVAIDDRWQSFIGFWLVAGLALLGIGIGVFVGVHNGHRLGGVLVLVGIACLAVGLGVRRAGPNDGQVKAMLALAWFAVVGFIISGCGSSHRAVASGPVIVRGTTTLSNVKVGTLIRCKGGPSARVPHWFGPSYLRVPGVPGVIKLRHRHGSVTVLCKV